LGGYGPPRKPKICERCGQSFMRKSGNGKYCPPCREEKLRQWENESHHRNPEHYRAKNRRAAVKLRTKFKQMVVVYYSNGKGACVCCGETQLEFLSIDHINNDGREDRQQHKSWVGSQFYYWLVRNNFPPGYQIMCLNCNVSRGRHGVCVHKLPGTIIWKPRSAV
jgi:hypothetical protein